MHKKIFLMLLVFFLNKAISQSINSSISQSFQENKFDKFSRLTIGLGHTHVSEGKVNGNTKWLAMPSWTINYDNWLSKKWAIGLQADLILENFIIESNHQELIERSYPLALVPVAIYKPNKHISLIAGIGGELSKNHNLAMTRLGVEYGIHLPQHWEVGTSLVWDGKWNYYNSWGLVVTFSKIWLHHK
ncbi:MAG: hypothetical protein RLY89_1218 [Bacteroidota bacterium]|jgi:hypothetical protein